jgi:hypothetical protein
LLPAYSNAPKLIYVEQGMHAINYFYLI